WSLHRLTGKVVSIFNGRVSLDDSDPEAFRDVLSDALSRPQGVLELFNSNMIDQWRARSTDNPDVIPVDQSGSLLYKDGDMTYIFSGAPNPFMGTFTEADLVYFASTRFTVWDHDWQDRLFDMRRLLVQTNLDRGMSIEIESLARDKERATVTAVTMSARE